LRQFSIAATAVAATTIAATAIAAIAIAAMAIARYCTGSLDIASLGSRPILARAEPQR
jgi:hypothetical protein